MTKVVISFAQMTDFVGTKAGYRRHEPFRPSRQEISRRSLYGELH
jgi:hypothetical protein